jgi:hypothetical protein
MSHGTNEQAMFVSSVTSHDTNAYQDDAAKQNERRVLYFWCAVLRFLCRCVLWCVSGVLD